MNPPGATAKWRAAARTVVRSAKLVAALTQMAGEIVAARRDFRQVNHSASRRLLSAMGVQMRVSGAVPPNGLIVCNHLSYLDVIVISAMAPAIFVAKSEVRSWPIFGWFARRTGTVFVERGRAASAGNATTEIGKALRAGDRVVLFPEGTSSGGETVLPFKSSLLEPGRKGPLCAAAVAYALEAGDGDPAEDVCYWKDMSLLPHLIRLLGKKRIRATLVFAPLDDSDADRKTLARRLHALVSDLKAVADREPRDFEFIHIPVITSA